MTRAVTAATSAKRRDAHPAILLTVLCAAMFMTSLDIFMVNVALRPIGNGLGPRSLADLTWILNAYAIVFAALLVRPAASFNPELGHQRLSRRKLPYPSAGAAKERRKQ